MSRRRARRWLGVAAAAAATVSVSSCGLLPHPHHATGPPPAPPGPAVPAELAGLPLGSSYDRDHTLAAAAATGPQATDPCALHDPAAAARATGQAPDQLQPGPKLGQCELRTGDWMSAAWRLTTQTGAPFSPGMARRAAPAVLGGLPVQRVQLGHQCEYYHPTGPGLADRLSVSASGGNPPPGQDCEIGAHYLAAVAGYWAHPARRADHATIPDIPLAHTSPCAGMRQLLGQLPPLPGTQPGATHVEQDDYGEPDPSSCTLYDGDADQIRAHISYKIDTPPSGGGVPTQIAGHAAEAINSPGRPEDGCSVFTQAGPPLINLDRHNPSDSVAPQLEVHAPTCHNAAIASAVALSAAGNP